MSTTIIPDNGESQYWQDRKERAMEALIDRMGIVPFSEWFDTLTDAQRGAHAQVLAQLYERKLAEMLPDVITWEAETFVRDDDTSGRFAEW